jgi:hypothetical protein
VESDIVPYTNYLQKLEFEATIRAIIVTATKTEDLIDTEICAKTSVNKRFNEIIDIVHLCTDLPDSTKTDINKIIDDVSSVILREL